MVRQSRAICASREASSSAAADEGEEGEEEEEEVVVVGGEERDASDRAQASKAGRGGGKGPGRRCRGRTPCVESSVQRGRPCPIRVFCWD